MGHGLPAKTLTGTLSILGCRSRKPFAVMLCSIARVLAAILVLTVATPVAAQDIPCGEPYTVRRGDTLQRIAERAYGPEASFRDLIEDNRQYFIGGDPSVIAIGQTLSIPCLTQSASQTTSDRATPPEEPAPQPPRDGPVLVAVDRSDGTDVTALLAAFIESAGLSQASGTRSPVNIRDVIRVLSATQEPRIADALPRPDCETVSVDPLARDLCNRLAWSAPIGEYVLSTFTLSDTGPVTLNESLRGKRLCLPMPLPVYLLARRGLMPPAAEVQQPANVTGCFTALRAGGVDAVIAPAMPADDAIAALGPGAAIIEQFALAQLVTLHSAALAENEAAREALRLLDGVLRADRLSAAGRFSRLPD